MKKYGIHLSSSLACIIKSEIVSTEIEIKLAGMSTLIHVCEIRKYKISNFKKKLIYLKGIYNSIIDSNIIYNSKIRIYLQDYHLLKEVVISNNININGDNSINYECLRPSYNQLYIIGNTIYKPKITALNLGRFNAISDKDNILMNNFFYLPDENGLNISNIESWNINNNYFYNVDNISSSFSYNARFHKGNLEDVLINKEIVIILQIMEIFIIIALGLTNGQKEI